MKYTFTTDAVSKDIQADDIDSAARQFGASNRIYAMETLKDLAGIIESNGGWLIVHEDGVIVCESQSA